MIKYLSRMLASYGIWRMRARQNRRRESWKPSSLLPVAYCTVLSAVLPLLADFGGGGVKDGRAQISPRQPCWVDSLVPALFTSLLVQLICIPSLLLATIQYSPVWPKTTRRMATTTSFTSWPNTSRLARGSKDCQGRISRIFAANMDALASIHITLGIQG
jgi:hypothetical protein